MATGLMILGFAIFSVGRGTRLFTGSEVFEAHFHRINGLQAGAPVTLSGVNIGAVESIAFPDDPGKSYVIVKIWVEASAAVRVHTDSVAHINTMGVLGDKFLELSPGTPSSPPAAAGAVLPSRDPIDYQAVLQKQGTSDLIANVIAISNSMRSLLETINRGHGLVAELVRGQPGASSSERLTLASIRRTLDGLNRLSAQLSKTAERVNRGRGLAAAMLSNKTDGRKLLTELSTAATAVNDTTRHLDKLVQRLDRAQGLLPRLFEDRAYADETLDNLRQSSRDLRDILHKINTSQGTIGLMVNDPALYTRVKELIGSSGGWGLWLWRGLYPLTHPFESPPPAVRPITPVPLGTDGADAHRHPDSLSSTSATGGAVGRAPGGTTSARP